MVKSLEELDRRVLTFMGRYRVVTRPVLAELLGSVASADKRIARLVGLGLVAANRELPQQRVAYQLTRQGVAAIGLSPARARRFGFQAVIKHLGLLLLCNEPVHRCERIETDELARVLKGDVPDAAYCLIQAKEQRVLVGLGYVPAPQTPIQTVVRRVRKMGAIIRESPTLEGLRPERRIGVLVVTDSAERRETIARAIRKPGPNGRPPVAKHTRVWVRSVPELARCLGVGAGSKVTRAVGAESTRSSLSGGAELTLFEEDASDAQ